MKYFILHYSLVFITSTAQAQFAGGSGTVEDPWQVATLEQLQEVGNHVEDHFVQTADIDAGETETWNDGDGFVPIGDGILIKFRGSYDGDGYTIENLKINRSGVNYVALFGYVYDGAVVKNIRLLNAVISGRDRVGSMAGRSDGTIENCFVTGEVTASDRSGGLTGDNRGVVRNSGTIVDLTGSDWAGGLIGLNRGVVESSFAEGAVTGDNRTGGLVGSNFGDVEKSYATGNVTGDNWVGGLIGSNYKKLHDSYAHGNVIGEDRIGGLVGNNWDHGDIRRSYAIGSVTGLTNTAGFAGLNGATIVSGYWDMTSSGITEGIESGIQEGVTGLSTEEMKGVASIEYMIGFDFSETWLLTDEYPALYWEDVEALEAPQPPEIVELSNPEDNTEAIIFPVTFEWQESAEADAYNLQISGDEDFTELVIDTTGITETSLTLEDDNGFEEFTTYYWRVQSVRGQLESDWSASWSFETSGSTDSEQTAMLPENFKLQQNYPNPFNPVTVIGFELPAESHVRLEVYDMLGRRIAVLIDERIAAGSHRVTFDGSGYSSGTYLVRMHSGDFIRTRTMMLIK